ncbi:uncharacterized protein DUF3153 [Melghirimyces profundicolus]|uniref:Uncharacterized protein DUF3153 n=1 Tax=Melghirimyces profundicolus TaxID=1242148 RepID=A0A2T6C0L8_9BACL|nr:DUF3153 domain-containing protein [Melghirimyces profundicolus]PTX61787.1 uncharacterized protein DUF3153 [Melghirimyces profundicolus]
MNRWKKKTGFLLILISLSVLIGGCVDADMHVIVHWDGSGEYRLKMLTHPLLGRELGPLQQRIENAGYRVKKIREGSRRGWLAVKKVENIAEDPPGQDLKREFTPKDPSASIGPLPGDQEQGPVKVDARTFTCLIRFRTNVDLRSIQTANQLEQAFLDAAELNLKLTLPLKAEKHNADSVSGDGRTMTWHLKPGQNNPVFFQLKVPNPVTWALIGLGVILLLIILTVGLIRRRRRRKTAA